MRRGRLKNQCHLIGDVAGETGEAERKPCCVPRGLLHEPPHQPHRPRPASGRQVQLSPERLDFGPRPKRRRNQPQRPVRRRIVLQQEPPLRTFEMLRKFQLLFTARFHAPWQTAPHAPASGLPRQHHPPGTSFTLKPHQELIFLTQRGDGKTINADLQLRPSQMRQYEI